MRAKPSQACQIGRVGDILRTAATFALAQLSLVKTGSGAASCTNPYMPRLRAPEVGQLKWKLLFPANEIDAAMPSQMHVFFE